MTDERLGIASRAFSLAAIFALGVAFSETAALQVSLVMVVLASIAVYLGHTLPTPTQWVVAVEAAFGSSVVVLTLPDSVLMLPYLVVLPLLSGTAYGIRGAALVISSELASVILLTITSGGLTLLQARSELLAPWTLTIIGAGLLGALAKRTSPEGSRDDSRQLYESARRLITQLSGVTRRLSSGLDPHDIAVSALNAVHDIVQVPSSTVFVMTDGGAFLPLARVGDGTAHEVDGANPLLFRCWAEKRSITTDVASGSAAGFALPLCDGDTMVGVLFGCGARLPSRHQLERAQEALNKLAFRLDTALAFDEIRIAVTADERQRLAREIHDGVAQELASLGYRIDDMAHATDDRALITMLKDLRGELSRVINELRLSIFDLRSSVSQSTGLGAALSEYLQMIGSRAQLTVHLTLSEASTRLSPGVETELFRIAQEAITNARKHSAAKNLWVDCRVRPPYGRIEVRDDGVGLGEAREDSYGLRIMRERAERVHATLAVDNVEDCYGAAGTRVTVTVG